MKLPPPQFEPENVLIQALRMRKSTREFSTQQLPVQVLANVLWVADGVNRPATGDRTAPSTCNWQSIDIYVANAEGLYLFDANQNTLQLIHAQDIRAQTGTQDFVGAVPVNLIFVSDFTRMNPDTRAEDRKIAAAIDTGFISENVYLYCTSAGLVTVVRASIDKTSLAKTMQLNSTQWIVAAQSVGYPIQS